eukprot:558340-Pelagomonas_calceolata.AAC.1
MESAYCLVSYFGGWASNYSITFIILCMMGLAWTSWRACWVCTNYGSWAKCHALGHMRKLKYTCYAQHKHTHAYKNTLCITFQGASICLLHVQDEHNHVRGIVTRKDMMGDRLATGGTAAAENLTFGHFGPNRQEYARRIKVGSLGLKRRSLRQSDAPQLQPAAAPTIPLCNATVEVFS